MITNIFLQVMGCWALASFGVTFIYILVQLLIKKDNEKTDKQFIDTIYPRIYKDNGTVSSSDFTSDFEPIQEKRYKGGTR